MRILILHNTYQQAGGEDTVVERETSLLQNLGHDVHLHMVSNDSIQGFWAGMVTALRVPYSPWGKREVSKVLADFKPEIVHVHNFFPLLTPSIYDACQDANVPVVQTLHNFRTICAGALLMRDGKPCEDCVQQTPYLGALHGCYRNSRLGSLAVARMIDVHRRKGTWANKINQFIAMTEFSKKKFEEAGFPSDRLVVKPNFIEDIHEQNDEEIKQIEALFVGRLSEEKGVRTLLKAWDSLEVPLRIIGDGPLMDLTRNTTSRQIEILGRMKPQQVAEAMNQSRFLVFPSECYEGFPLSVVEAFSHGLPVIGSRLGAMAEIIEDGVTGLHFTAGDPEDFSRKVRWASEHPKDMRRMGQNARRVYEEKYTPETNYRQLIRIYSEAIEENKGKPYQNLVSPH